VSGGKVVRDEITAWFGCPNPDLCEDPECVNPVHLPDRESWTEAEELASWLEEDRRAERRNDR
jgi:hypothetical protein